MTRRAKQSKPPTVVRRREAPPTAPQPTGPAPFSVTAPSNHGVGFRLAADDALAELQALIQQGTQLATPTAAFGPHTERIGTLTQELLLKHPHHSAAVSALAVEWQVLSVPLRTAEADLEAALAECASALSRYAAGDFVAAVLRWGSVRGPFEAMCQAAQAHMLRRYDAMRTFGNTTDGRALSYQAVVFRGDVERYRDRHADDSVQLLHLLLRQAEAADTAHMTRPGELHDDPAAVIAAQAAASMLSSDDDDEGQAARTNGAAASTNVPLLIALYGGDPDRASEALGVPSAPVGGWAAVADLTAAAASYREAHRMLPQCGLAANQLGVVMRMRARPDHLAAAYWFARAATAEQRPLFIAVKSLREALTDAQSAAVEAAGGAPSTQEARYASWSAAVATTLKGAAEGRPVASLGTATTALLRENCVAPSEFAVVRAVCLARLAAELPQGVPDASAVATVALLTGIAAALAGEDGELSMAAATGSDALAAAAAILDTSSSRDLATLAAAFAQGAAPTQLLVAAVRHVKRLVGRRAKAQEAERKAQSGSSKRWKSEEGPETPTWPAPPKGELGTAACVLSAVRECCRYETTVWLAEDEELAGVTRSALGPGRGGDGPCLPASRWAPAADRDRTFPGGELLLELRLRRFVAAALCPTSPVADAIAADATSTAALRAALTASTDEAPHRGPSKAAAPAKQSEPAPSPVSRASHGVVVRALKRQGPPSPTLAGVPSFTRNAAQASSEPQTPAPPVSGKAPREAKSVKERRLADSDEDMPGPARGQKGRGADRPRGEQPKDAKPAKEGRKGSAKPQPAVERPKERKEKGKASDVLRGSTAGAAPPKRLLRRGEATPAQQLGQQLGHTALSVASCVLDSDDDGDEVLI